ncbi:MAG: GNAT family N-acetyltransferase [Desulfarculaceae bacterium]|jgi:N-acetylglutamate synthase-like GNAT family acetyltransferase
MQWEKGPYFLTDDKSRMDIDYVARCLVTAHWALDRTREQVEESIRNSLFFSLFQGQEQIGFARMLTDHAVITYLGDVFIDPAHRGQGLGKWMLQCLMTLPQANVSKVVLITRDAHGLYEKFGFERIEAMIKKK